MLSCMKDNYFYLIIWLSEWIKYKSLFGLCFKTFLFKTDWFAAFIGLKVAILLLVLELEVHTVNNLKCYVNIEFEPVHWISWGY